MTSKLDAFVLDHDSLLNIIEEYEDDSIKIKAYIDFAEDIRKDYPDSAFIFLQIAEEIATRENSPYFLSVIHNQEGLIFDQMNEYVDALEQYFHAKNEIESIENFENDSASRVIYVQVLNQLGVLYFKINKFDEGLEYLNSLIEFMRDNSMESNNKAYRETYLKTYINIGAINIRKTNYDEAEINYTKALSFLKDDDLSSYAVILNNLGIIAKEQKDYQKAFDHHKRALVIRTEKEDLYGMCQSHNNLGATYWISDDKGRAKYHFEQSLQLSVENAFLPSSLISLGYLQMIHQEQNDFRKAYEYQSKQVAINDSLMNQEILRTIAQMEMQEKFDR